MFQFKALSVRQPYAAAIMQGVKTVEWRVWETQYRGPLILHASSKVEEDALGWAAEQGVKEPWVTGAYLGVVFLDDVAQDPDDILYKFYLRTPLPFPSPLYGPGKLGLFIPSVEVVSVARLVVRRYFGIE